MRMRETLVKEISDVIMERVKSSGYDMVFDKVDSSTNLTVSSSDVAARSHGRFTTDVVTTLNKRPATTTTEKPATSPAAATTTAPATSPKKP